MLSLVRLSHQRLCCVTSASIIMSLANLFVLYYLVLPAGRPRPKLRLRSSLALNMHQNYPCSCLGNVDPVVVPTFQGPPDVQGQMLEEVL